MPPWIGRQLRGSRGSCLNAVFVVVGENQSRVAGLMFRSGRGLLDELHLAIDAQNLRHLLLELRVAAFQVIADFVRLYLLLIEYVAQRALSQLVKAGIPLRRTMPTHRA